MIDIEPGLFVLRARRRNERGGEWDEIRSWPKRRVERLTSAGFLGREYGYAPDQLAADINATYGADLATCDAVELWGRAADAEAGQRIRAHFRDVEHRLSAGAGVSWYQYRAQRYGVSVHAHARAMGWR